MGASKALAGVDFRVLFESSPNPYMLLDRDLRYVHANKAYERVTASRIEDLVGRHVFEAFPNDPEDPNNRSTQMLRDSFARVLATRQPDVLALVAYKVPAPDGGTRESFWSATHTPVLDANGDVQYILQHTVDVTEVQAGHARVEAGVLGRAKQVQEANVLLDSERNNLRSLFQQAPGFTCFLSGPNHVFELTNAGYENLVGHRKVLGKSVAEALPEVVEQGFVKLLDAVYASGQAHLGLGTQVLLQRHPGEALDERYIDFIYQPIHDAAGRVRGIFVQGNDITEQKRLALEVERLARIEKAKDAERLALLEVEGFLSEAIPQQVWRATPAGALDFVNGRVIEYFGTSAEEILGSGWVGVIHPDDVDDCVKRWTHSLQSGERYEVEFRLRRADGTYRWHLGRADAMRDAGGHILRWYGTNTDIDEARRVRDELQKRSEYEQQLIGIVSHDLRNPLNAIGLATSLLLKRGRLDEAQGKSVARIISSSERAGRMIRDFLDFTQARSLGGIPIEPKPSNLREIASQVFDEVHLAYSERLATLDHAGEETGVWDPDRIAQVIGNLVSNAFQHSPADSVVLVATRCDAESAIIEVHNAGAPIPAASIGLLFEPFQRGEGMTGSKQGRSIGLGLYIAKQIVDAHGGTIAVRSAANEGTSFTVRMPREVRSASR